MKIIIVVVIYLFIIHNASGQFNQHQYQIQESTDSVVLLPKGTIDKPAEFKGGFSKFYKFIGKKLRYPKEAKRLGIEGKVFVGFVIEKDGSIPRESVKVVKGLFDSCDREAVRVIRSNPKWIPARKGGSNEAIAMQLVVPITFKR